MARNIALANNNIIVTENIHLGLYDIKFLNISTNNFINLELLDNANLEAIMRNNFTIITEFKINVFGTHLRAARIFDFGNGRENNNILLGYMDHNLRLHIRKNGNTQATDDHVSQKLDIGKTYLFVLSVRPIPNNDNQSIIVKFFEKDNIYKLISSYAYTDTNIVSNPTTDKLILKNSYILASNWNEDGVFQDISLNRFQIFDHGLDATSITNYINNYDKIPSILADKYDGLPLTEINTRLPNLIKYVDNFKPQSKIIDANLNEYFRAVNINTQELVDKFREFKFTITFHTNNNFTTIGPAITFLFNYGHISWDNPCMGIAYIPRNHIEFPTDTINKLVFYLQNERREKGTKFENIRNFDMLENTTYTLVLERSINPNDTEQSKYTITLTPHIKEITHQHLASYIHVFTGVDDKLFINDNLNNSNISIGTLNNAVRAQHNFPAIIYQYKIEDLMTKSTTSKYHNFMFNNVIFKMRPNAIHIILNIIISKYVNKRVSSIYSNDITLNGNIIIDFENKTHNLDDIVSIDILNNKTYKRIFSDSLEYILFRNTVDDTELHMPAKLYNLSTTANRYIFYNKNYTNQEYIDKLNLETTIDAHEIIIEDGLKELTNININPNATDIIKYVDNTNKLVIDDSNDFYRAISIDTMSESRFRAFEFGISFHTNIDFSTMPSNIAFLFDYGEFSLNNPCMGIAYNKEHPSFPENTKNKLVFYLQNESRTIGTKIENVITFDILPNATYTLKLNRNVNVNDPLNRSIHTINLQQHTNNNEIPNTLQTRTFEGIDNNLFKMNNTLSIGTTNTLISTNRRKFPGLIYEYYIKELQPTTTTLAPTTTQPATTPASDELASDAEVTSEETSSAAANLASEAEAEETTEAEETAAAAPEQETTLAPATTTTQAATTTTQAATTTIKPNNFRGLIKGPNESFINQSNNQGLMKFIDKYKYEIDNNINILIHSCTIYIDKDFENNNIFSSTTNISENNQLFITKSSDGLTIRVSRVLPNINRKTITIDNLTYELQFKNTTEYTTTYIINNIKNMVDILKNTNNIENVDILFIIDTSSLPLNNNSNILNIKSAISNGKVIHIIWNFDSFKKIIIYMKEFFAENTDELDKLTEQEQKQIGTNAKQILIDNDILIDISHDINRYDKFTVDGIDYLSAEIYYNINSVQYNTQPPTTTTQARTSQSYEPQTVIPAVVEVLNLSMNSKSNNLDQFTNINNPMRYSNNNLSYNVNKYNYDSTSASLFDKLFK